MSDLPLSPGDRAQRLFQCLAEIAKLRRRKVSVDYGEEEKEGHILWWHEIPQKAGCQELLWNDDAGEGEEDNETPWLSIEKIPEPPCPPAPALCQKWLSGPVDADGRTPPTLQPTMWDDRTGYPAEDDAPESSSTAPAVKILSCHLARYLKDAPEVQEAWEDYLQNEWHPWARAHQDWKEAQAVYNQLFRLHEEAGNASGNYELVLGLGLLHWRRLAKPKGWAKDPPEGKPSYQRLYRHLLTLPAVLDRGEAGSGFVLREASGNTRLHFEVDLLGDQLSPRDQSSLQEQLRDLSDSRWRGKEAIIAFLESLANILHPEGRCEDRTPPGPKAEASDVPVLCLAPALVLRRRSIDSQLRVLGEMEQQLAPGTPVAPLPPVFRRLAEMEAETEGEPQSSGEEEPAPSRDLEEDELFFPLPSNPEQRRIVASMRHCDGILVQGPPGTGKSHTIANLICHLLATGQRLLITARGDQALRVLRDKLPEGLRSLCIGFEENRSGPGPSPDSDFQKIRDRQAAWESEGSASVTRRLEALAEKRRQLRQERNRYGEQLKHLRAAETSPPGGVGDLSPCGGTPSAIARAVSDGQSRYGWFVDRVSHETPCPVTAEELRDVLGELRHFTPPKRAELAAVLPEEEALLPLEEFRSLVGRLKTPLSPPPEDAGHTWACLSRADGEALQVLLEALRQLRDGYREFMSMAGDWRDTLVRDVLQGHASAWEKLLSEQYRLDEVAATAEVVSLLLPEEQETLMELSRADEEALDSTMNALRKFRDRYRELSSVPEDWKKQLAQDMVSGRGPAWQQLLQNTCKNLELIGSWARLADEPHLVLPAFCELRTLYDDVRSLQDHLRNGGRLGWFFFRSPTVKQRRYVLEGLKISEKCPRTQEDFDVLEKILRVRFRLQDIWECWTPRIPIPSGTFFQCTGEIRNVCSSVQKALALGEDIDHCRKAVAALSPDLDESIGHEPGSADRCITLCRLARKRKSRPAPAAGTAGALGRMGTGVHRKLRPAGRGAPGASGGAPKGLSVWAGGRQTPENPGAARSGRAALAGKGEPGAPHRADPAFPGASGGAEEAPEGRKYSPEPSRNPVPFSGCPPAHGAPAGGLRRAGFFKIRRRSGTAGGAAGRATAPGGSGKKAPAPAGPPAPASGGDGGHSGGGRLGIEAGPDR